MPRYSIITCISKPQVYNDCLLKSLAEVRGEHDIEIIPIINNDNLYSASNALNLGIRAAKSDNLIFVHQDVRLLSGWFDKLEAHLSQVSDDWGIIGAAGIGLEYGSADIGRWGGAKEVQTVAVGTVYDSDESAEPYWNGQKELTRSHCADECLFILNKKTGLTFDNSFNGFHFYGVDICLQARAAGYEVYCCDLPLIHYGKYSASFTGDRKYWVFMQHLFEKWKHHFPEMFGTHMHWFQPDDGKPELTSYIPIGLQDDSGISVTVKAMGLHRIQITR